jgi:hypothetical protein
LKGAVAFDEDGRPYVPLPVIAVLRSEKADAALARGEQAVRAAIGTMLSLFKPKLHAPA